VLAERLDSGAGEMNQGLQALTEREKRTLRLLLEGHDAKSIARELDLSVHTINERLRDARRKLGVSSSREAARILVEGDPQSRPQSVRDNPFGVFAATQIQPERPAPDRPARAGQRLAWLGGGMLVMSLMIAALSLMTLQGGTFGQPAEEPPQTLREAESAALGGARAWVALLDAGRWDESLRTSAPMFQSIGPEQWKATIEPLRQSLGPVSTRVFKSAARTNSLPGVPVGEYEIIEFSTRFATRDAAVETVVLSRETAGWKVAGYFIR
jgi:DNA-binding CsgD family transcriptional regulator